MLSLDNMRVAVLYLCSLIGSCCVVKLAFHDTDTDTDCDRHVHPREDVGVGVRVGVVEYQLKVD